MSVDKVIRSPDTDRKDRVPPHQRVIKDWPVLHYGGVPRIDVSRWSFNIFGLVEEQLRLTFSEFERLPKAEVFSDIHCVTGWSRLDNLWEGVGSRAVSDLVRLLPTARFVMIHGAVGFTTNLSLEAFQETDVLFATKHDGRELSPDHGHPVRLVVPRLYFWKSAKWVTGIEFMAEERPGFWESNGYHIHGDPWREERYSSGLGRRDFSGAS